MDNLITSLDLGSENIKSLVVLDKKDQPGFEILAEQQHPSKGIRRGAVVEPGIVTDRIETVVRKLNREVGQEMNDVLVNVSGSHLNCRESRGTVAVSRADHKISEKDIDRVVEAAKTFSLPSNQEILDVFPKEFVVDGDQIIDQPLGMEGVRLEAKILAICAFSPYLENLTNSVLDADLNIIDLEPSSLAASRAVLSDRQKELGAAMVDIGAWSTDLAVFKEKDLVHLAVFPVGSAHITNDVAIGLQTDVDLAEEIKREHGTCQGKRGKGKKIEMDQVTFREGELVKIVKARTSEIFEQIAQELDKVTDKESLPGGVYLTGGGSNLPGLVDLAKEELELPCRTCSPDQLDPAWSTAWGLILRGSELNGKGPGFKKKLSSRIKRIFKIFVP